MDKQLKTMQTFDSWGSYLGLRNCILVLITMFTEAATTNVDIHFTKSRFFLYPLHDIKSNATPIQNNNNPVNTEAHHFKACLCMYKYENKLKKWHFMQTCLQIKMIITMIWKNVLFTIQVSLHKMSILSSVYVWEIEVSMETVCLCEIEVSMETVC